MRSLCGFRYRGRYYHALFTGATADRAISRSRYYPEIDTSGSTYYNYIQNWVSYRICSDCTQEWVKDALRASA